MTSTVEPPSSLSQLRTALVLCVRHLRTSAARLPEDAYGRPGEQGLEFRTALAAEHLRLAAELERALLAEPPKAKTIDCTPFVRKTDLQLGLRVDDLEGEPLYTGDIVVDQGTGLLCVVISHDEAVRHGMVSSRRLSGWRRPA